jgi:hypothetical protein
MLVWSRPVDGVLQHLTSSYPNDEQRGELYRKELRIALAQQEHDDHDWNPKIFSPIERSIDHEGGDRDPLVRVHHERELGVERLRDVSKHQERDNDEEKEGRAAENKQLRTFQLLGVDKHFANRYFTLSKRDLGGPPWDQENGEGKAERLTFLRTRLFRGAEGPVCAATSSLPAQDALLQTLQPSCYH